METWIEILLSVMGGSLISFIGSILYFRPKLIEAQAQAAKATSEAEKEATSASSEEFDSLRRRANSLEELYQKQGEILDDMRLKQLKYDQDMLTLKEKSLSLEFENKRLLAIVENLEKEVEAYKILVKE